MHRKLSVLMPGQRASITGAEENDVGLRLVELGFSRGTAVSMIRCAPFGNPAEYALNGGYIALRKADAANISVDRDAVPINGGNAPCR